MRNFSEKFKYNSYTFVALITSVNWNSKLSFVIDIIIANSIFYFKIDIVTTMANSFTTINIVSANHNISNENYIFCTRKGN